MFYGFQCGVRSLTKYHDKLTTQQQRTRNNFGNRIFLAMVKEDKDTEQLNLFMGIVILVC